MPNLTMADAASRTMKKGWALKTEKEDEAEEAQSAREAAAKTLRRGSEPIRQMNSPMKKAERRRSPLYDRDEPEED